VEILGHANPAPARPSHGDLGNRVIRFQTGINNSRCDWRHFCSLVWSRRGARSQTGVKARILNGIVTGRHRLIVCLNLIAVIIDAAQIDSSTCQQLLIGLRKTPKIIRRLLGWKFYWAVGALEFDVDHTDTATNP
jgi:hypothetical protein